VSSLSKIYGFPGLRVGWLVGPPEVVEACVNYRRYTTISNSPILEAAAVMVFDERERYVREYEQVVADRLVLAQRSKRGSAGSPDVNAACVPMQSPWRAPGQVALSCVVQGTR
jgi:aspartate/methionine/tyrosine aminotransferase